MNEVIATDIHLQTRIIARIENTGSEKSLCHPKYIISKVKTPFQYPPLPFTLPFVPSHKAPVHHPPKPKRDMPLCSRTNSQKDLMPSPPVQITIQVETEVEVEIGGNNSHGLVPATTVSTVTSPRPRTILLDSSTPPHTTVQLPAMSLPRSNYDPRRVCLNPFPEFTLGKHKRTVGVYLAGALVCTPQPTNFDLHTDPLYIHSSLLQIGHSWMLLYVPNTPILLGDHTMIRLHHPYTSRSSIGSQASAPSSVSS